MAIVVLSQCLTHTIQAQGYDTTANGLPILNSAPNAYGTVYMDFDGGPALGGTLRDPYDIDGDTTTYSDAEQQYIYNGWLDVATNFAMFDLNITTVAPDKMTQPTAHVMITQDVSGAANLDRYGDTGTSARAQVGYGLLPKRVTTVSHEVGHVLGLNHQSLFDEEGNMVQGGAYRGPDAYGRTPMMGRNNNTSAIYAHWANNTNSGNVVIDEISFIANKLVEVHTDFSGGTYAGDGYRADDHGNDTSTAARIVLSDDGPAGESINVSWGGEGIVERFTDTDVFELVWAGGELSLSATARKSVASPQPYASSLGMNLSLYDQAGNLLLQDLASDPADVDAELLNLDLGLGVYYFAIESAGGEADLGVYDLSLSGTTSEIITHVPSPSSLAGLVIAGLACLSRRHATGRGTRTRA